MSCTGFDGYAYYNTGTDAIPVWVEIDIVRDVNTTSAADKADTSDRRSKFKKSCPALIDMETTMTLTYENGNTVIAALRTHFLARTNVQIAIMDGPVATSGSEGWTYFASVYSNDFTQPLSDGQTVSVTFAPTINAAEPTVEPTWLIVA